MKTLTSVICAAAMAVSTVGLSAAQASAQKIPVMPAVATSSTLPVVEVQSRWERERRGSHQAQRGFERRGDRAYFRGHRGYRHARPGWRQYQGWWFPPAAFALGAIIGGAIAQQPVAPAPRYRTLPHAHVVWCQNRYRSYRVSDNTFQPYQGPRRQCTSPYA